MSLRHETVYCSGLWLIPDNIKRSIRHYESLLPKTLAMIQGSRLHFFSDDDEVIEMTASLCRTHNIQCVPEFMAFDELPAWTLSERLVRCCEGMELNLLSRTTSDAHEKGVVHYWRDLMGSGRTVYRKMLAVWLSKVELTARVADASGSHQRIAWIDSSVSRFNKKRKRFDFSKINIPEGKIAHYSNLMRYYGNRLPLNASFMGGDKESWDRLRKYFDDSLKMAIKMPYGHDEETVLADCVRRHPELFFLIDSSQGVAGWFKSKR